MRPDAAQNWRCPGGAAGATWGRHRQPYGAKAATVALCQDGAPPAFGHVVRGGARAVSHLDKLIAFQDETPPTLKGKSWVRPQERRGRLRRACHQALGVI